MESLEQKDEKKKSSKAVAIFAGVFIIAGAAFAAYQTGVIPGFGAGNKVASQLKADIESAKGGNIKNRVLGFYKNNPSMPAELKDTLIKSISEGADMSFDYAALKTSSGEGKGTVEIDAPKLSVKSATPGAKAESIEIRAKKLFISRDVNDASHYFFHSDGNLEFYIDAMSATPTKLFSVTADTPYNEFKISPDMQSGYMKSSAKNVKFIEGRGNTVLAIIGESYMESERKNNAGKLDIWGKLSFKNIAPGDMIKIMLGQIEPLNINMDYAYNGDDYKDQFVKMMDYPKTEQENRVKAMQDPNFKPAAATPPEFKPFDGTLKLNDLSVLMGNAGFVAKANLVFKKDNPKVIPVGTATVKIAQYQKLIDYFKKFFPIPQEQVDNSIKFLSEIGQNSNGDIIIDVKMDGTDNILVGGKTEEQIRVIEQKYYPAKAALKAPSAVSPDAVQSAPPAPVMSKPIIETGTKI